MTPNFNCQVTYSGAVDCGRSHADDIPDLPGSVYDISAQVHYACAVFEIGSIHCWPWPQYAWLVHPDLLKPPAGRFVAIRTGSEHACAVRSDGTLACWGSDHLGQSSPPSGSFASVSLGWSFTCGVRLSGELECWGDDFSHKNPFKDSE